MSTSRQQGISCTTAQFKWLNLLFKSTLQIIKILGIWSIVAQPHDLGAWSSPKPEAGRNSSAAAGPYFPILKCYPTKEGKGRKKKEKNLDSCKQTSGATQEYHLFSGDTWQSRGACVAAVCVCACVHVRYFFNEKG